MQGKKTMLLLGGTSDIGLATALVYAGAGYDIIVAVRNLAAAERNVRDVRTRTGAQVEAVQLDILRTDQFDRFVLGLSATPDTVVCVIGELGDQQRAQTDLNHAAMVIRTNFEGPALLLGLLAEKLLERGTGVIVGVSSVAGERGRRSNYVYGSAKAGLTAFLSGLRSRLLGSGVRVVSVVPGFVRTRMTANLKLPSILTAEPGEVAHAIYNAAERRKADVIYVRRRWRIIMAVIRLLPEAVFKRLNF